METEVHYKIPSIITWTNAKRGPWAKGTVNGFCFGITHALFKWVYLWLCSAFSFLLEFTIWRYERRLDQQRVLVLPRSSALLGMFVEAWDWPQLTASALQMRHILFLGAFSRPFILKRWANLSHLGVNDRHPGLVSYEFQEEAITTVDLTEKQAQWPLEASSYFTFHSWPHSFN